VTYRVRVAREFVEYGETTVVADSEDEAIEAAYKVIHDADYSGGFEGPFNHEVTDVEEVQ